jgi:hypothetical protein
MSVVYMRLSVSIHGLKIENQEAAENFLKGWIRTETLAGLKGNNASLFGFRDWFESDIEVEVEEHAGVPDIQKTTEEQEARKVLEGAIAVDDSLTGGERMPRPSASWGLWWRPIFPDSITIGEHDCGNEYSYGGITLSIKELEVILWWMKNKGKSEAAE